MGIDFSGPFFKHDPVRTWDANVEAMLSDMAQFGERDVKARIGNIGTGRTKNLVHGRVESLGGRKWHRNVVVSPDTSGLTQKEAISVMAAASSIERRYHPFKRAASDMRKVKPSVVSELLKGLA